MEPRNTRKEFIFQDESVMKPRNTQNTRKEFIFQDESGAITDPFHDPEWERSLHRQNTRNTQNIFRVFRG